MQTGGQQRTFHPSKTSHAIRKGRGERQPPSPESNINSTLTRQLQFPREITEPLLRPDLIMWSEPRRTILMVELTVPWEEVMEATNEWKHVKYAELAAECREAG